ncbi:MAG TPA: toll/interleukin-1 receptor domain-containing protein [Pyrinomonadaceae bacterium]|nr:toll/interleukin-1 receptor domain-containing protein [Pyrinomonadaceae bacterium]
MPDFTYDVFISYSHSDVGWVRGWLLPRLESAGLRVCIDHRDFKIGVPSLVNMEKAVEQSSKTLLIMTPNWVKSEWTNFESLLIQTEDPGGVRQRTLPLLLEKCQPPRRLGILTYADFIDPANRDNELKRVIAAIAGTPTPQTSTHLAPNLVHPYPLQANFTGRVSERKELTAWLADDARPVCALIAMGGMGKSALAWYWVTKDVLPDPAASKVEGVMWWSFYEGESSFAKFVDEALRYVSQQPIDAARLPTAYDRAQELRRQLQGKRVLFVLDGFERQLRAYASLDAAYQQDESADASREARACVDPTAARWLKNIAASATRAKVMLTTRLMVRDLEDAAGDPLAGALRRDLKELPRDDAVDFMRAQGVTKGVPAEIAEVCAAYGNHPLSLRLLSGFIKRDRRAPGDIAAAPRVAARADFLVAQHHILEQSYNVLPEVGRTLLSRIAAFRSPMTYDALAVINDFGDAARFDGALDELQERGLVQHDAAHNRYDLHPIVRHYAYDRLIDKTSVHARLRGYFAKIPAPHEDKVKSLEDLAPVIELYHHTVHAGRYDQAYAMYDARLRRPLYYRLGAYELDLNLLLAIPRLGNGLPQLSAPSHQTWNLLYAAMCFEKTGRPQAGLSLLERAIELNRATGDKFNLASTQVPFAMLCCDVGNLEAAYTSINESVGILDVVGDSNWQGISHRCRGRALMLCGNFAGALEDLELAETVYTPPRRFEHGLSVLNAIKAQIHLLQKMPEKALEYVRLAGHFSCQGSYIRESISADLLMGMSLIETIARESIGLDELTFRFDSDQQAEIERHLGEALTRCRRINLMEIEADILLAWARWYRVSDNLQEAHTHAEEALGIADRCEYRLKQADIHNFLARLALDVGDRQGAREQAEIARERAWCDGPPHCYRPALDEAEGVLRELGAKE